MTTIEWSKLYGCLKDNTNVFSSLTLMLGHYNPQDLHFIIQCCCY